MRAKWPGYFVTFEGPEGAGKSTQIALLAARLRASGREVVTTIEPGGTPLGERLRAMLLRDDGLVISPEAETLLFCAARAQLVADVIRPSLERGAVVLCDRFADSTLAYQHFGRGVPRRWVEQAIDLAIGDVRPDLSILLNLVPEVGLARKRGSAPDRFEAQQRDFHERVRLGYDRIAAAEPSRWLVLDAERPVEEIAERIASEVLLRLVER